LRVLFDPFVIRSDTPAEYGIHLMACFFIVYHHGGKIEARSQDGRGTVFTLRLPLHPERAPAMAEEHDFLQRALLNEKVWEKLIASS
jgi:K+-sensing histidine kinase KdpD